jgi:hypothetical protein
MFAGRDRGMSCGHGASTILLVQAFPRPGWSDSMPTRRRARPAAGPLEVAGSALDLVCFMDAFHDLGDPP